MKKTLYLREPLPPTATALFKNSAPRILIEGEGSIATIRDKGDGGAAVHLSGGAIATFPSEAVQCVIELLASAAVK